MEMVKNWLLNGKINDKRMAVEWQKCSGKNLILKWLSEWQNHGSSMVK